MPTITRRLRRHTLAFWLLPTTVLMCLLLTSSAADASVTRTCDVSYLTPQGWTTPTRLEVVFQSGRELNKASTNYFSYSALGKYALIPVPFGQAETAIVEISAALVPDSEGFSNENFKRLFSIRSEIEAEQINNKDKGRKWKIIAKEGLPARFIDPRVEGDANASFYAASWTASLPSLEVDRHVQSRRATADHWRCAQPCRPRPRFVIGLSLKEQGIDADSNAGADRAEPQHRAVVVATVPPRFHPCAHEQT